MTGSEFHVTCRSICFFLRKNCPVVLPSLFYKNSSLVLIHDSLLFKSLYSNPKALWVCFYCTSTGTSLSKTLTKAELPKVGILFALNFLPWEFLFIKKLEMEKTKTTQHTTFKTDIIKVALIFLISNFLTNKTFQRRKLSAI